MLVYRSGITASEREQPSYYLRGPEAPNGSFGVDLDYAKQFEDTRHFFNYLRYHGLDMSQWSKNGVLVEIRPVRQPRVEEIRAL